MGVGTGWEKSGWMGPEPSIQFYPQMQTPSLSERARGGHHLGESHELADVFRQEDHVAILGHHGNESLQRFQVQVVHLLVSFSFRLIFRANWKEGWVGGWFT